MLPKVKEDATARINRINGQVGGIKKMIEEDRYCVDILNQIAAVRSVFAEVDARKVPEIIVLNKADAADPFVIERLKQREPRHVVVSARTGEGISELLKAISDGIPRPSVKLELLVPYHRGDLINKLHESDAEILSMEHEEGGTRAVVMVREGLAAELESFITND